jgi:REP element-mobilizing transposase RayT
MLIVRASRDRQQCVSFGTRGGKRPGAGRKPNGPRAGVSHLRRPLLAARFPIHVTVRVRPEVAALRSRTLYPLVWRALCAAARGRGFRIVHFSVLSNHIHLMVEAADAAALARGMQRFSIRVAMGINHHLARRGGVLADRYHAVILRSPRQVRHALAYVLQNAKHHARQTGALAWLDRRWVDPCSSAMYFDGWTEASRSALPPPARPPPVAPAETWLLSQGWRMHGLIDLAEVPGPRR